MIWKFIKVNIINRIKSCKYLLIFQFIIKIYTMQVQVCLHIIPDSVNDFLTLIRKCFYLYNYKNRTKCNLFSINNIKYKHLESRCCQKETQNTMFDTEFYKINTNIQHMYSPQPVWNYWVFRKSMPFDGYIDYFFRIPTHY